MKSRPEGFLAPYFNKREHEVVADYIRELHEYLWRFVRAETPVAQGKVDFWVDDALAKAEKRRRSFWRRLWPWKITITRN